MGVIGRWMIFNDMRCPYLLRRDVVFGWISVGNVDCSDDDRTANLSLECEPSLS